MLSGGPTSACAAMAMTPTSSPLRVGAAARPDRVRGWSLLNGVVTAQLLLVCCLGADFFAAFGI